MFGRALKPDEVFGTFLDWKDLTQRKSAQVSQMSVSGNSESKLVALETLPGQEQLLADL